MSEPRDILRFPPRPNRPVMGVAVRWLTLVSFTAGTIGVPLEPAAVRGVTSAPTCAKRPGEACKCSSVSRALGKCCCSRGTAKSVTAESARERRPEPKCVLVCSPRRSETTSPPLRSCCAKKLAAKLDQTLTIAEQSPHTLSLEACGCGTTTPSAAILLCGDPRVLSDDAALNVAAPTWSRVAAFDQSLRGQRPRPDVPPPKSLPT